MTDTTIKKRAVKKKLEIDKDKVVEYASKGLSKDQVAACFGITRQWFYKLCKDNPDLEQAYEFGRSMGINQVANVLFNKCLEGDTTAMIYFLKSRAGWSDKTSIEVVSNEEDQELVKQSILEKLENLKK